MSDKSKRKWLQLNKHIDTFHFVKVCSVPRDRRVALLLSSNQPQPSTDSLSLVFGIEIVSGSSRYSLFASATAAFQRFGNKPITSLPNFRVPSSWNVRLLQNGVPWQDLRRDQTHLLQLFSGQVRKKSKLFVPRGSDYSPVQCDQLCFSLWVLQFSPAYYTDSEYHPLHGDSTETMSVFNLGLVSKRPCIFISFKIVSIWQFQNLHPKIFIYCLHRPARQSTLNCMLAWNTYSIIIPTVKKPSFKFVIES